MFHHQPPQPRVIQDQTRSYGSNADKIPMQIWSGYPWDSPRVIQGSSSFIRVWTRRRDVPSSTSTAKSHPGSDTKLWLQRRQDPNAIMVWLPMDPPRVIQGSSSFIRVWGRRRDGSTSTDSSYMSCLRSTTMLLTIMILLEEPNGCFRCVWLQCLQWCTCIVLQR